MGHKVLPVVWLSQWRRWESCFFSGIWRFVSGQSYRDVSRQRSGLLL